jgi:N-carbamoylputrescine amidase
MRVIKVAATQMSCNESDIWDIMENIKKADKLVRQAKAQGVNIVLLQELFETPYFCQHEIADYYKYATELENNPAVNHFKKVALELNMVIPVSFFEKCNQARYNSIAVIDATGEVLGVYRKSHIPDGPGYEEKFYFNPGDTGFMVFNTKFAKIGIGICWDQWYPETARCLALLGAEIIFYPTAIGSEPHNHLISSKDHWQTCMRGHAAANLVPVVASNRIGVERIGDTQITFYGSSFIADYEGKIIVEADNSTESVISATFDLDDIATKRAAWGIFRDRRPDLYKAILTYDGHTNFLK